MKPHPLSIVTPARTGGKIGLNRRTPARLNYGLVLATLGSAAISAAAIGLIAGILIR